MEAELEETQAWRRRENDVILQCSIIVKKSFYYTPEIGIFEYLFPSPTDYELHWFFLNLCKPYYLYHYATYCLHP